MAYYRGAHSPRDEPQAPAYSNPLSPQRNPNRLSGGMASASTARGGLTRRFTTNELPLALSPIGQQRKLAAGDYSVSTIVLSFNRIALADKGRSGEKVVVMLLLRDFCVAERLLVEVEELVGRETGLDGRRVMRAVRSTNNRAGTGRNGAMRHARLTTVCEEADKTHAGIRRDGYPMTSSSSRYHHKLTNSNQSAGVMKSNPSEDRARRYEQLLREQRQIQAELAQVDPETRFEVEQGLRHEEAIAAMLASSEQVTPPDYAGAFPNAFSKPNRYSNASLTSVPGVTNRPSRSSTQLTSPSAGFARSYTSAGTQYPSQSVPGSRRQSDDEEDDATFMYGYENGVHRAAANPNRNSMPVTGYNRKRNTADLSSLGAPNNLTSLFLDEDDDRHRTSKSNTTSPPTAKTYLQMQQTADGFPKLIRREDNVDLSSSALDLAFAQGVEPQQQLTDRNTASRHRISLPPSALSSNYGIGPLNSILANADSKASAANRRSVEVKFSAETKRPSLFPSPPRGTNGIMQKPSSSYSTNDIPTLKSINGAAGSVAPTNTITSHSGQSAGLSSPENPISRVTSLSSASNINSHRLSQDLLLALQQQQRQVDSKNDRIQTITSALQASAPAFGPMPNMQDSPMQNGISPYAQTPYYANGYNMQMLNNGFGNMNVGGFGAQPQWPGPMNV
ncbi:hypothetical protein LTR53_016296, partial [Teratosphaeriaceae sp. CCFEE 6253]